MAQCKEFTLKPIEVPEGCAEVVERIAKTFTTTRQWFYLRAFMELYGPWAGWQKRSDNDPQYNCQT
jgi:hypothetical protein